MNNDARMMQLDMSDPKTASIASDGLLLGIWGYLRLAARPMTLPEIASSAKLDPALVQRKLDLLAAYGIVEALPLTSRRRSIAWRILYDGLMIGLPETSSEEEIERKTMEFRAQMRQVVEQQFRLHTTDPLQFGQSTFLGLYNLTADEVKELQRRLQRAVDFATLLSEKYAARGEVPELCNFVLSLRAEPLRDKVLPLAPVHIGPTDQDGAPSRPRVPLARRRRAPLLSPREREVAVRLARGLTAVEVAKQLGLQRSTVATMTKRIYAKVGVRRRAELASRLEELLGGLPAAE